MRAVVQRVRWAKVTVDGEVVGAIEHGLLVYLGVGKGDGEAERRWLLDKILTLRIFTNEAGKFDRSVIDVAGSLLVVSQFTLFADVRRGRRPGFDDAMPPADAEREYETFVAEARTRVNVATGTFRAHMLVESGNDGPVTIWLDSFARGTLAGPLIGSANQPPPASSATEELQRGQAAQKHRPPRLPEPL